MQESKASRLIRIATGAIAILAGGLLSASCGGLAPTIMRSIGGPSHSDPMAGSRGSLAPVREVRHTRGGRRFAGAAEAGMAGNGPFRAAAATPFVAVIRLRRPA